MLPPQWQIYTPTLLPFFPGLSLGFSGVMVYLLLLTASQVALVWVTFGKMPLKPLLRPYWWFKQLYAA
jgi:hypothetical protein